MTGCCGCMLGKTVEGIRTDELVPFLKETGNYPMHRYIYRSDLSDEICAKYRFGFAGRCYADEIDGMPVDDDTNYVVLAQEIISNYGKDFTPHHVSDAWPRYQSKDAYCTAERVAFCLCTARIGDIQKSLSGVDRCTDPRRLFRLY